jgi:chromosome segregation ATPase
MERQLQEMLTDIKSFVKEELGQFKDEFRQEIKEIKTELAEVKQDVAALKQDVSVLKQDVSVLKQDVSILKHDVAVLQQDVAEIRQEMRDGFADVNRKLDTLYEQVAVNTEYQAKVDDVMEKISELETDVRIIKKIVANQ